MCKHVKVVHVVSRSLQSHPDSIVVREIINMFLATHFFVWKAAKSFRTDNIMFEQLHIQCLVHVTAIPQ